MSADTPVPTPTAPGPRPGRRGRRVGGLLGVVALGVAGVVALTVQHGVSLPGGTGGGMDGGTGGGPRAGAGPAGPGLVDLGGTALASLSTFASCDGLRDWFVSHALPDVGPYGWGGPGGYAVPAAGVPGAAGAAERAQAQAPQSVTGAEAGQQKNAAAGSDTRSATGTNVQVSGVDEADVAKRVGDLLVTVAGNGSPALHVLRATGRSAKPLGTLPLSGWRAENLLVDGDTVLLIGRTEPQGAGKVVPQNYRGPRLRIAQVSLADPAHPRLVRTLEVSGQVSGARLVDGVVRLAVEASPNPVPRFVTPQGGDTPQGPDADALAKATARNKELLRGTTAQDWLPSYTLTENGGASSSGPLVGCADVTTPTRYSGLTTLTLMSIDLRAQGGLADWRSASVVASGSTMYATAGRTYLATAQWRFSGAMTSPDNAVSNEGPAAPVAPVVAGGTVTQLHVFDTVGRTGVRYAGGGEVPGSLLNQFSLDESDGVLRVATTTQALGIGVEPPPAPVPYPGGAAPNAPTASARRLPTVGQSQVSVLRLDGGRLHVIGSVGGLGRGERIQSVRFLGKVGYVVTYRQTDPLYTLDLSDPSRPRVVGELHLLGYSAYLHPAGPGLLLGVGVDATATGRTTGLQVSLFDVADPAHPRRVSQAALPATYSSALADHHAFTFVDGLVLVPVISQPAVPVPVDVPPGAPATSGPLPVDPHLPPAPGVLALRLEGRRLSAPVLLTVQAAPDTAPGGWADPLRTYVDGGIVWTVTSAGLAIHDADTLRRVGFVAWPA